MQATHISSISYLVYSQIWLNLSMDDCHFGYNKKFLINFFVVIKVFLKIF